MAYNENPPPYREKNGVVNGGFDMSDERKEKIDSNKEEEENDPWALPELKDTGKPWDEMSGSEKAMFLFFVFLKISFFLGFLYLFICSLDFLSSAFKLLGGKAAGTVFRDNTILSNPVAGLMIGVLATVLVQSSSTSTSIVVAMVGAGGLLDVRTAIPIVMGANIGTSVTNTIVALGQITDKADFRRAFAGATVHDMFNWLAVIILLPLEVITGYLYKLSDLIMDSMHLQQYADGKKDLLKAITKPFTKLIIEVDKKGIEKIAKQTHETHEIRLLKVCCKYTENKTDVNATKVCVDECDFLFRHTALSDEALGGVLLVLSLLLLCVCLFAIVKLLNSLLRGNIRKIIKKFVNYDFPGKCSYFTGYLAILIGCGLTILVQSSSIFTSTMTPLVGVGVISLDRMYPLTLGANIGTTTTGILAALASDADKMRNPLQVAMCHLFFNISGILLFYPITYLRFPVPLAKFLGNETAKYRWFAIVYLILMFFLLPAAIFGLSVAGWQAVAGVLIPIAAFVIIIAVIKVIQNKKPHVLPKKLQNWKFLPLACRSLEPYDRIIQRVFFCKQKCRSCRNDQEIVVADDIPNKSLDVVMTHI